MSLYRACHRTVAEDRPIDWPLAVNGLATTHMDYLIVRRGLDESFYKFLKVFAAQQHLDIVLDRRLADRRGETQPVDQDRRRGDRRGPPPPSWKAGDFIAVKSRDR